MPPRSTNPPTPTTTPIIIFFCSELSPELPDDSVLPLIPGKLVDVVTLVPTATSPLVVKTCCTVEPLLSILMSVVTICFDALVARVWMTTVGVAVVEIGDDDDDDDGVTLGLAAGVGVIDGAGVELGAGLLLWLSGEVAFSEDDVGEELVADVVWLADDPVPEGAGDCRFCKASSRLTANAAGKTVNARRIRRNDNEECMTACRRVVRCILAGDKGNGS
jgi:hypothetical protein